MSLCLAVLQLAAAQAPTTSLPDIEFDARIRADEVIVRQDGNAQLTVRVTPGDAPPVEVKRSAPAGAQRYRNLTIDLRATAHISDPNLTQQGNNDDVTPP